MWDKDGFAIYYKRLKGEFLKILEDMNNKVLLMNMELLFHLILYH